MIDVKASIAKPIQIKPNHLFDRRVGATKYGLPPTTPS
jgi:hypothetical protein